MKNLVLIMLMLKLIKIILERPFLDHSSIHLHNY